MKVETSFVVGRRKIRFAFYERHSAKQLRKKTKSNSLCSQRIFLATRWLVAARTESDGVTSQLHEVAQNTFFTDTNIITLDSIYFKQGSRISCVARAVNNDGEAGLESTSKPVTGEL